jgi:hypothetical protein
MKKLLGICLGVFVLWSLAYGASVHAEAFGLAERVGEPNERTFFLFSTSAGSYILRHDGMGEFTSPRGMRRVFMLKVGAKARIEQVYFLEHERDVFLFYEVHDATEEWAYLVRMEQTKRKLRWSAMVNVKEVPAMQGDRIVIGETEISKSDGKNVGQD